MPFDGSGNFNRVMNWVADATALIKIKADRHDSEDDNFAAGLSNTITKDGQSQPTANIPMNGKRLVNLGAPVNPTDAVTKSYADAIRDFSTGIDLTGAVPEARIGFTAVDLGFGVREAGTPVDTLNRFVWNTEPDLSGTDIMVLDDTGKLTLLAGLVSGGPASITGGFTFNGTAFTAFTDLDVSWRARTGPNRIAFNDKADGTGTDVYALDETGKTSQAERIVLTGIEAAGVSKALLGFNEISRSIVARKGNGSTTVDRIVINDGPTGAGANDLIDLTQALTQNKDGVIKDAGYTQTPRTTPDAPTAGAYTPTPVGGLTRQVNAVGTPWTFNAPTFTGNYTMVVLILNTAISGAVTFAGFNRVTGGPHPTAINRMSLVYITKVGAAKTAYVEVLPA